MTALIYLVPAIYILLWIALLVDAFRRRRLFPLTPWTELSRLAWLLTFPFFNPLLSLLYAAAQALAEWAESPPARRRGAALAAWALIIAIFLIFEFPYTAPGARPFTLKSGGVSSAEPGGGGSFAARLHLGARRASTSSQVSTSHGGAEESVFPARRILILNEIPHPLTGRAAARLAGRLAAMPGVEEVAYYPEGMFPPGGGPAPDVVIRFDGLRFDRLRLPLYRTMKVSLSAAVSSAPFQTANFESGGMELDQVQFLQRIRLDYEGAEASWETPASRYHFAAESLAGDLSKAIGGAFSKWRETYPEPPPDSGPTRILYGKPAPAARPAFLPEAPATLLVTSGYGLLTHEISWWRFAEPRADGEALSEIAARMEREGWKSSLEKEEQARPARLRLRRGEERIEVFRLQPPPAERPYAEMLTLQPPMIACYKKSFSPEEKRAALREWFAANPAPPPAPAFARLAERLGLTPPGAAAQPEAAPAAK